MRTNMFRRGLIAFVSVYALACGGPPPDTPSAVILFTPETICQGDAHESDVHIDGTMSSRHLSLVPLAPEDTSYPDGAMVAPLAYAWTLEGDEHTVTEGSLTSSTLTVTAAGDRPLHVTLTTTNLLGGTATSVRSLPITVPTTWTTHYCAIDADCPMSTCEPASGVCVSSHACMADRACPGSTCDLASGHCVPLAHCVNDAGCDPCFVCNPILMACVPRPS